MATVLKKRLLRMILKFLMRHWTRKLLMLTKRQLMRLKKLMKLLMRILQQQLRVRNIQTVLMINTVIKSFVSVRLSISGG